MSAREWRDLRITKATEGGTHVLINTKLLDKLHCPFPRITMKCCSNKLRQE